MMGGERRMVGSQTGGDRRAAGGCVALVGIRVGIGASWGRRRVGDRRGSAPRAARGCVALVGGLAGIATDVAGNALVLGAILGSPYPDTSLAGTTNPHRARWQLASPPRALVAPRIPFTARIGVGAVQNRRPDHRFISTVCGDAGRPAHQRHKTPRCARRHHDRIAPVCGTATRRFAPVCGPATRRSPPRRTHASRRSPPVCGPTARRFPPRRLPQQM
jgi:hypothetical protein